MNNQDLQKYIFNKYECSIQSALNNKFKATKSRDYRIGLTKKSKNYYWSYIQDDRNYIYALDTILIGKQSLSRNRDEDICRIFCIRYTLARTLTLGFDGYEFYDSNDQSDTAEAVFNAGRWLRNRFSRL